MMVRTVFILLGLACLVAACAAPALPQAPVTAVPATAAALENPTATNIPLNPQEVTATPFSAAPEATATVEPTLAPTAQPTQAATATLTPTLAFSVTELSATITPRATVTNLITTAITATNGISPTATVTGAISTEITATNTVTATATRAATPRPKPTAAPAGPAKLTPLLTGQVVTSMYMDPQGNLFYGTARQASSIAFPYGGDNALWKLPAGGAPMQMTPFAYNQIGGITSHGGYVYFSEAGALRRIQDSNNQQDAEVVIRYPQIIKSANLPYGHMNHALQNYSLNGQQVLLMAVGSILDSSFPCQGCPANIAPPYYEPFPTGRINYATFDWLDQTHNYIATQGVNGQFDEFARGVRNPWGMTVGNLNGQTHIYAVDNDPAFTPEKYDSNPANSGDELNEIQYHMSFGHPYAYGGQEPAVGAVPPIITFNDGSVPSGVAIAGGKLFVSLHDARKVVKVDPVKRTFTTVLDNIEPFSMIGSGNILYIADFNGINIIDARGL